MKPNPRDVSVEEWLVTVAILADENRLLREAVVLLDAALYRCGERDPDARALQALVTTLLTSARVSS